MATGRKCDLTDSKQASAPQPATCGAKNAKAPRFAGLSEVTLRRGQKERNLRIPRGTDEWRSLYRRRSAVEREFGRLKHHYALASLRVRGIERIRLHAT